MKDLIKRNTPNIADCFRLETIEAAEGKNVYEVEAANGKIVLRGDCALSLAMAYYWYLRTYCHVQLSHCGNAEWNVNEAPLPAASYRHVVQQTRRVYLNYCTFGYSMAWWGWEEWEREIDFMAMQGINMPLSIVGSEAVWYYTLRELGYSEKGALSYLSGPAFWPWQLMTNIDSFFALTEESYIQTRVELGKKIIERQLSLGMTPIQQGYSGQVPKNLIQLFPKAHIRHVKGWCGFPITYQLDPVDPVFLKIGKIFLEKQRQIFGAYHYYACDPFHENEPPVSAKKVLPAYLQRVGKGITQLYEAFDKQSVWVMQSWSLREEIVKAVPKEKLLILDIDGQRYKETQGFWGYSFVLGTIHSFGDRNTLHGSIKELADNPYTAAYAIYPNTIGTGLFPEGIRQNPLYYDLAFHMLTQDKPVALTPWLEDYALRRYGSDESCLREAVFALRESCYSDACTGRETGSVLCARPSTDWLHTGMNDKNELQYDNKILLRAAQSLLQAENAVTDGYRYDACDIVRQVLSNHAHTLYHQAIQGYNTRDIRLFERSSNAFLKLFGELDELLDTRPELSLPQQLKKAPLLATSDADKQNFEINLLTQVTLWGPVDSSQLYDYAWKEWSGMLGSYYAKRWHAFFEYLSTQFKKRKPISTNTKTRPNGRDEYQGSNYHKQMARFEKNWLATYKPEEPSGKDTLELAKALLQKYEGAI